MARRKDVSWGINLPDEDGLTPNGHCQLAVLMDLRDELKQLNRVFACPNFQAVPQILRTIRRNTTKPRKRRGVK